LRARARPALQRPAQGEVFREGAPAAIHRAGGFEARQAQHLAHDFRNDHRADVAAQALMVAVAE